MYHFGGYKAEEWITSEKRACLSGFSGCRKLKVLDAKLERGEGETKYILDYFIVHHGYEISLVV